VIRLIRSVARDRGGSSAIEFAIAVPILMSMIWGIFQLSLVFEANAGMTNALGQAARQATIWPTPSDSTISSTITSSKFGVANGTWGTPTITTDNTAHTKTITVSYSQPLTFLFFDGPNVNLTKTKVIYLST
jgi:Flp pilus assembly protein TadG